MTVSAYQRHPSMTYAQGNSVVSRTSYVPPTSSKGLPVAL
jgi:hypothetical protein